MIQPSAHLTFWDSQKPCEQDYKQLVEALSRRFASTTGEPALRFQLGQRHQEAAETLDEFADALLDLANRAYPELDSDV